MIIRPATVEDLPNMAECARAFYASSKFLRGFDMERFCALWKGFIEAGTGVIFGLFEDQAVKGAIAGISYPEMYSGELQAIEMAWFVMPECRGKGLNLLLRFEQWARAQGCKVLRLAHLADSMPEKLTHVYGRLGFTLAESQYIKELA